MKLLIVLLIFAASANADILGGILPSDMQAFLAMPVQDIEQLADLVNGYTFLQQEIVAYSRLLNSVGNNYYPHASENAWRVWISVITGLIFVTIMLTSFVQVIIYECLWCDVCCEKRKTSCCGPDTGYVIGVWGYVQATIYFVVGLIIVIYLPAVNRDVAYETFVRLNVFNMLLWFVGLGFMLVSLANCIFIRRNGYLSDKDILNRIKDNNTSTPAETDVFVARVNLAEKVTGGDNKDEALNTRLDVLFAFKDHYAVNAAKYLFYIYIGALSIATSFSSVQKYFLSLHVAGGLVFILTSVFLLVMPDSRQRLMTCCWSPQVQHRLNFWWLADVDILIVLGAVLQYIPVFQPIIACFHINERASSYAWAVYLSLALLCAMLVFMIVWWFCLLPKDRKPKLSKGEDEPLTRASTSSKIRF